MSLPYLPPAYTDEIFGSWLARILLYNGPGAWKTVLEACGFRGQLYSQCFGGAAHSTKLEVLLGILGTTYTNAILDLTLIPYWFALEGTPLSESDLLSPVNQPRIASLSSFDRTGSSPSKFPFSPRWCPKCLAADTEKEGEPYWHRCHQLPNVFACHLHGCILRSQCRKCGKGITGSNHQLWPLPRLMCACGASLLEQASEAIVSEAYTRLIEVSCSALRVQEVRWNRASVLRSLETIGKEACENKQFWYHQLLADTYGASRLNARVRSTAFSLDDSGHDNLVRLSFNVSPSGIVAPDCAAILAAANHSLDSAIAIFQNEWEPTPKRPVPSVIEPNEITRNKARKTFRDSKLHIRNQGNYSYGLSYWYLRLYDGLWLHMTYPRTSHSAVPRKTSDRMSLQRIASTPGIPQFMRLAKLKSSSAGLRAALRDREFFERVKAEARATTKKATQQQRDAMWQERTEKIRTALFQILEEEEKPVRINAALLARKSGLSHNQASETLRRSPKLKNALKKTNEEKYKRQIFWAARRLHAKNTTLSSKRILKEAGTPSTKQFYRLASLAAADVVAGSL